MAQRQFHCYACSKDFKEMIDLARKELKVNCKLCQSEYIEEIKSYKQALEEAKNK